MARKRQKRLRLGAPPEWEAALKQIQSLRLPLDLDGEGDAFRVTNCVPGTQCKQKEEFSYFSHMQDALCHILSRPQDATTGKVEYNFPVPDDVAASRWDDESKSKYGRLTVASCIGKGKKPGDKDARKWESAGGGCVIRGRSSQPYQWGKRIHRSQVCAGLGSAKRHVRRRK